jgi:hypothetical protein
MGRMGINNPFREYISFSSQVETGLNVVLREGGGLQKNRTKDCPFSGPLWMENGRALLEECC